MIKCVRQAWCSLILIPIMLSGCRQIPAGASDSGLSTTARRPVPVKHAGTNHPLLEAPGTGETHMQWSTEGAKRVNIKFGGPPIGTAPHSMRFSVDLPPELTHGADFLWKDNGVWMGDEASGVKILESTGLHRITVVVLASDNQEYRGLATVQVLQGIPGPKPSKPGSRLASRPRTRTAIPTSKRGVAKCGTIPTTVAPGDCDVSELPKRASDDRRSVAVIDFHVDKELGAGVGRGLADVCRGIVQDSRAYLLLDRENMLSILGEEDFALVIKCDNTRCLVDFGKKLLAQKMVHGRVSRVGQALVLTIKMTDVSSAKIEAFKTVSIKGGADVLLDYVKPQTCELLRDDLEGDKLP